jgi:hypothetical protein
MAPKDCLKGISILSELGAHSKFLLGGQGPTPRLVLFIFDFKNYVIKIMS